MRDSWHRPVGMALVLWFGVSAAADDELPQAEFPRAIVGRVTDATGKPVAEAMIGWGYFSDDDRRESVATDADGKYRLQTSKVGRDFRLGISKDGFAPAWQDRVIPGPASRPTKLDVTLHEGTNITVQITNTAGEPIKGIEVTPMTPSNGFRSSFSMPTPSTPLPGTDRTLTTDDSGTVVLKSLPGEPDRDAGAAKREQNWLLLRIHQRGVWVYEHNLTVADLNLPVHVVVLPDYCNPAVTERQNGVVRGRVIDKETRRPVTDYILMRRYVPEPQQVRHPDGRFTAGGTMAIGRKYQMRVFVKGYAVGTADIVAREPDNETTATIELTRHPSFEGRLVDAASGKPLSKVRLMAGYAGDRSRYVEWSTLESYADGHHRFENVVRVTTDEEGNFSVSEAKDHPATLVILTPNYERRIVEPEQRQKPNNDGVSEIRLQSAASITAVALRDTQLGALATSVSLYYPSDGVEHMYHATPLDENGRLTFDSMPAGKYQLSLYYFASNTGFACYSKSFDLAAGEKKEVTLGQMPGTLRVYGTAAPFAVVKFSLKDPAEIGSFAVPADIDGRFELRGLSPGEYMMSADVSSASSGYFSRMPSHPVNVTANMEINLTADSLLKRNRDARK